MSSYPQHNFKQALSETKNRVHWLRISIVGAASHGEVIFSITGNYGQGNDDSIKTSSENNHNPYQDPSVFT